MPNNLFRFKKFTIHQESCTMKVNTDSCIFGAAVDPDQPARILDIGTGSGLLALMMAQRFGKAMIDAIEPDHDSADQAEMNFRDSPWPERIRLHKTNAEHFAEHSGKYYDLIITNPPWFNNSLKSTDERKNSARHVSALTWKKLSIIVNKLLTAEGILYILLPMAESLKFREAIESERFTLTKQVIIKSHPGDTAGRIISGFTRETFPFKSRTIAIKDEKAYYSNEFKLLVKDFYLAF